MKPPQALAGAVRPIVGGVRAEPKSLMVRSSWKCSRRREWAESLTGI